MDQDIFGIIGVSEYHDGWKPGRAVFFNARGICPFSNSTSVLPMLELVYSELKYPCKTFVYTPGEFSNYSTIDNESYHGPACDD